MTRQSKGGMFSGRVAPSNADICPGCGSHCVKSEADRTRSMINGSLIEDLRDQLKAANLRISALEIELNAAKRRETTAADSSR